MLSSTEPPSELNWAPVRWHSAKYLSSCCFYYLFYRIVLLNVFIWISHSLRIQNIGDIHHLYEVCFQTYAKGCGHGSGIGSLPLPGISGIEIRHMCRPPFYLIKHYKWMKESIDKIHLKINIWWEMRFSHQSLFLLHCCLNSLCLHLEKKKKINTNNKHAPKWNLNTNRKSNFLVTFLFYQI